MLLDLLFTVGREVRVAFHTDDAGHLALVVATQLVAQPGTELQHDAATLRDKFGDRSLVCLEANEVFIYARKSGGILVTWSHCLGVHTQDFEPLVASHVQKLGNTK